MEPIGEAIKEKERTIFLTGADSHTAEGYTQVPNVILTHKRISPGAKLVYAMLLKYDWYYNGCFPGQARLAKDMGVSPRSVVTYLKECEEKKLIKVVRRKLGRTNLYYLNCKIKTR